MSNQTENRHHKRTQFNSNIDTKMNNWRGFEDVHQLLKIEVLKTVDNTRRLYIEMCCE